MMATTAAARPVPPLTRETRMFVQIAAVCLVVVAAGFGLNTGLGRVDILTLPWAVYGHGVIFMAWCLLAIVQPMLIGRANRATHRRLGWTGIALAVAMGVSGLWLTVDAVIAGRMRPGNLFMMINILTVIGFLGLIGAAILLRRNMAWHGRLMTSATIILTGPAWARLLPMQLLGPAGLLAISGCVLALAAWGMLHDLRTRGRIHPAWYWGAGIATGIGIIGPPLAFVPAFSGWVSTFAAP